MKIARTREELAEYLAGVDGSRVGFVPTMGALHEGHISLIERAVAEGGKTKGDVKERGVVVASVFVNPTQFNDPRDLERYPRTPKADLAMLEQAGVDMVFMPTPEVVYPEPDGRVFDFGMLDKVMEGASRPGHFNGVAQVVSRLFELVKPARAYFGEKDFQQLAIMREMVRQLGMGVGIVACPIVRDLDGLALSSRNALLDEAHRAAAPAIYEALREGAAKMAAVRVGSGLKPGKVASSTDRRLMIKEVEDFVTDKINSNPLLRVEYFEIVNSRTLRRADADAPDGEDGLRGCVAVLAGDVRLIDNMSYGDF